MQHRVELYEKLRKRSISLNSIDMCNLTHRVSTKGLTDLETESTSKFSTQEVNHGIFDLVHSWFQCGLKDIDRNNCCR